MNAATLRIGYASAKGGSVHDQSVHLGLGVSMEFLLYEIEAILCSQRVSSSVIMERNRFAISDVLGVF